MESGSCPCPLLKLHSFAIIYCRGLKTFSLFAASLLLMGVQSFAAETPDNVLNGYAMASTRSDQQFRGASMNVDIVASVPSLEKTASLQGIRKISGAGAISYDSLHLSGDGSVRKEIIARYLSAEENRDNVRNLSSLALTPANYKFQYQKIVDIEDHQAYLFRVRPRHKRQGSFDGSIWIDAETYLPLWESGRLIQHSIFLRRLTLTRKFRIIDRRLALPESTNLDIETRLVGRAQMTVKLHDVSLAHQPGNEPGT
jgi:hypothetical protein